MQQLRLQFRNNQTFRLTLDFSQIDALYPGQLALPTTIIRMQANGFEWVTGGTAQGSATYDAGAKTATFLAPQMSSLGMVFDSYHPDKPGYNDLARALVPLFFY